MNCLICEFETKSYRIYKNHVSRNHRYCSFAQVHDYFKANPENGKVTDYTGSEKTSAFQAQVENDNELNNNNN